MCVWVDYYDIYLPLIEKFIQGCASKGLSTPHNYTKRDHKIEGIANGPNCAKPIPLTSTITITCLKSRVKYAPSWNFSSTLSMADWITPYRMAHNQCLSIGQAPSQGIVYAIDEHVVVKLPFQYPVTNPSDCDAELYRDDSLRSLELLRKEANMYKKLAIRPHPNIVRCLYARSATCLFLERAINPLQLAQAQATKRLRYCWIRQLLSAVVRLEELGYTHGDLALQNIGIDGNDCLKLFDFGNATSKMDDTFQHMLEKDHSGLATCLYFLLTGVDPLAKAKDWSEVRYIQRDLSEGRFDIMPEAIILRKVILDGWTGAARFRTFGETREIVERIIGADDDDNNSPAPKDFGAMEAVCVEWLSTAIVESLWLTEEQYREKLKILGHDIEEESQSDG